MLSKQRLQQVFEQFLVAYPNSVFDANALANFALQGLFHMEIVNFGGNTTTGELCLTASEVLSSRLQDEDELVFLRQNKSTVSAEIWSGDGAKKERVVRATNVYDATPLADSMVSLARKIVQGG